jgi:multisubunit Na+/H+ antiporter MnhB subunit
MTNLALYAFVAVVLLTFAILLYDLLFRNDPARRACGSGRRST